MMKVKRKILLAVLSFSLFLPLISCKKVEEPYFQIEEDICLTTNENINWDDYIDIFVGNEKIDISNATITLVSGDDTKSGVCTYEISYQELQQTFTVTFNYPHIPLIKVTIADEINLASNQNIKWSDYITVTSDGTPVTIENSMITLLSGDDSVSGTCQYEFNYQGNKKTFEVVYSYPTPPASIVITISKNIILTSNQNISWNNYITIISDGTPVTVEDSMITLLSGDASISGTCQYELNYQGNKKTFNVTFQYSTHEEGTLIPSQKLIWNRAIAKNYTNMTVDDQIINQKFYITPQLTRCDVNNTSIYMKPSSTGYEIYKDDSWASATETEISNYTISFDFSKIDTSLLKYDETYDVYIYSSGDLSFCPYYSALEGEFQAIWFGIYDDHYISYIGFDDGETVWQCLLSDFGTTNPGTPSSTSPETPPDTPIITPEITLGDLQTKAVGEAVEVTGIVVGKTTKGILIKDLNVDEYVYVYKNGTVDSEIGTTVSVSGSIAEFGGAKQISNPTIQVVQTGGNVDFNPTNYTGSDVTAYAANVTVGVPVSITGVLSISGQYYNFTVPNTSVIVSICYPTQDLKNYNNQELTVSGYLIYLSGSNKKYANLVLVSFNGSTTDQPSTEDPTTGEFAALTETELTAWQEALALDYSSYTIDDSIKSNMQKIDHTRYYSASFDENSYVCLDYYKEENNTLYNYTASGWKQITTNPLLKINFDTLKNLSTDKLLYHAEENQYYISTKDLAVATLIPGWKNYTASYIYIDLYKPTTTPDEQNPLAETVGVAKIGIVTSTDSYVIFIRNIGTTTVENPEETCHSVSILDVQSLATDSLCTVSGTVIALTKTGFLVGDNINQIHNSVYVNLGRTPEYQIGEQVKIFGIATAQGTSLEFDSTAKIEKLEGTMNYPVTFDYFTVMEFDEYLGDPGVGVQVEFVATYTANSLQVEYFSSSIELIAPTQDLTAFSNQQVLVTGYLLYLDDSNGVHMVLNEISPCDKNPYLVDLTEEQKTMITAAKAVDYTKNYTIIDGIYLTTTQIDSNGLITVSYNAGDENNPQEVSYQLRHVGENYEINEGNGWTSITQEEYISSAVLFQFQLIDISKFKYNTKTGLYELAATDLNIEQFAPFLADTQKNTYLGYRFSISDNAIGAVQIVTIYENTVYADTCMLIPATE